MRINSTTSNISLKNVLKCKWRENSFNFSIWVFHGRKELSMDGCPWKVSLHKKWSFRLWIYSVNVTKSVGNCEFAHIYWRNPSWKILFFVKCLSSWTSKKVMTTPSKFIMWCLWRKLLPSLTQGLWSSNFDSIYTLRLLWLTEQSYP